MDSTAPPTLRDIPVEAVQKPPSIPPAAQQWLLKVLLWMLAIGGGGSAAKVLGDRVLPPPPPQEVTTMAAHFDSFSERLGRIEAKLDRIEKTAVGASLDVDEIRSEQKRAKKERASFDEFMTDWYRQHPSRRPRPVD